MRPLYPAVILLVLVAFFPFTAPAATDPMSFSLAISAGQWKAVRLQNLPKDVQVSLAVQSDGPLSVGFLDSRDHQRFPQVGHPLFWGQLEAKLGFSVTVNHQLEHLKQHPQPWSDSTLIDQELSTRQASPFQEQSARRPKFKA